jgi:multicomponent K+:H+ antiporter subunit E
MTLTLIIIWLFLVNTVSLGQIILGTFTGVVIPLFTNRFWPERPQIDKPLKLVRFLVFPFMADIITANLSVVRLILQRNISTLRSGFIEVPLDTTDPMVISILASVISLTPGTVTAEISHDRTTLIVHSLDIPNEHELVQFIKTRYEAPLKEIFSC